MAAYAFIAVIESPIVSPGKTGELSGKPMVYTPA